MTVLVSGRRAHSHCWVPTCFWKDRRLSAFPHIVVERTWEEDGEKIGLPRSVILSAYLFSNPADAKSWRVGLIVLVVAPLRKEGITDIPV